MEMMAAEIVTAIAPDKLVLVAAAEIVEAEIVEAAYQYQHCINESDSKNEQTNIDSFHTKIKNSKKVVMYIIINNDLNMSPGKIASQAAHVAANIVADIMINYFTKKTLEAENDFKLWEQWMIGDAHAKIILGSTETKMRQIIDQRYTDCRYI